MKGLPYAVQTLLAKARESALLAVETYNRPTATFRSGAYIVLMVIAWTSLFHAIFLRRGVKPYHRKAGSRRYKKVDGDYWWWELAECVKQFHKDSNPPIRKNLEFIVGLRNKIEHKTLPRLDAAIFGECQASLMNFESLLCGEFGDRYALRGGLTFALHFSPGMGKSQTETRSKSEEKNFKAVKEYIETYRSALTTDIQNDLSYSFKVYLIPKISNHPTKDAIAVEFVKYDPSKPDEMKQYEKVVSLIKPKHVSVTNLGLLKPGDVVSRVGEKLGRPFNMHHHILCYRHFNVRPAKGVSDPAACDARYCHYDAAHRDYLYTPEWVDHLVEKLKDQATHDFIIRQKKAMPSVMPST
jgi:hypothetical protein